jgi:hypothetical protein
MSSGQRLDTQGQLFQPDLFRYSPVTAAVMLRLPDSNAKYFAVASSLGSFLDFEGSSRRLKSGKDASGTLITKRRRAVILHVLKLSSRRWRELVADWEARHCAHRCEPGTVFLFARPLYDDCPACHTETDRVAEVPPQTRLNRGPGFGENDAISAAEVTQSPPFVGRSTAAPPALAPPLLSTSAPHRKNRSLRGEEIGEEGSGLVSTVVADVQDLSLGLSNSPRELECDCGHGPEMHFISGICRRCDCIGGAS